MDFVEISLMWIRLMTIDNESNGNITIIREV